MSDKKPNNYQKAFGTKSKARTNFLVFGIVAIGVAGAAAFVTKGGSSASGAIATLKAAPEGSASAGVDKASESYLQALRESNAQQIDAAQKSGSSAVATLTSKSVKIEDAAKDAPAERLVIDANKITAPQLPTPPVATFVEPKGQSMAPGSGQPLDAEVKLKQAVSNQVNELFTTWRAPGQEIVITRDTTAAAAQQAADAAQTAAATDSRSGSSSVVTLIPTGTIFAAVLDTEVVSDDNGPILASVVSGPYKGAKLLGQARVADEKLAIQFSSLTFLGQTVSVSAFAVDQNSSRVGMADAVDTHWFKKYGLVFLSSFVGGYGEAAGTTNQTITETSTGQVVQQSPLDPSTRAVAALGKAGTTLAQQLGQESSKIQTTVTVHQGSPIGVLFVSDVTAKQ